MRHACPPGKTLGVTSNGVRCACPMGTMLIVDPFGGQFLCAECLTPHTEGLVGEVRWPFEVKAKRLGISITGIGVFEQAAAQTAGLADIVGELGARIYFDLERPGRILHD